MDTDAFDRLTHLFGRSATRRSALISLLATAAAGTSFGSAVAKPQPNGLGKSNSTGKSKGSRKRRSKRQGRVGAETQNKNNKPGNHCIYPDGITDLNEFYGISAQIVAPVQAGFVGCDKVGSGEQWVNTKSWIMEHTFVDAPDGFVPAGNTPLEDFVAKFVGVRYVIDPGTKHEKTVSIPTSDKLFIGEDDGFVLVSPGTLGTVHPLPVGDHVLELYWEFSDMHCDGFADPVIEFNCFLAGETLYSGPFSITVVPGHN